MDKKEIDILSRDLGEVQAIALAAHESLERAGYNPLRDFEAGLAGNMRAYDLETRVGCLWQFLVYTTPRFELQSRFHNEMTKLMCDAQNSLIVRQLRSRAPRIWSYRQSYQCGFAHTDFGPTKHNEIALSGCLFADGRINDAEHSYAYGWTLSFHDKIYLICADELTRDEAFSIESLHAFPVHQDDEAFWDECFTPIVGTVYEAHRYAVLTNRRVSCRVDDAPEAFYASLQNALSSVVGASTIYQNTNLNAFVATHSAKEILDHVRHIAETHYPAKSHLHELWHEQLALRILEAVGCDAEGNMPHAHSSLLLADPVALLCLPDDNPILQNMGARETIKHALARENSKNANEISVNAENDAQNSKEIEKAFEIYRRERRWLASFPAFDLALEEHAVRFGIPVDAIKTLFHPDLLDFRVPIAPQGDVLKQLQTKFGFYAPDADFPRFIDVMEAFSSRQFAKNGNMASIAQWIFKVCYRWRYCKTQIDLTESGMQRSVNQETRSLLHRGLSNLADMFKKR